MPPTVSICIATYNKPDILRAVLLSVFRQQPTTKIPFEVIVADDGPGEIHAAQVCKDFPEVKYLWTGRDAANYRNPSVARNVSYRAARGEIIICQSDDVVHVSSDAIDRLAMVERGTFNIATVFNVAPITREPVDHPVYEFTGPGNRRPLFFLGSLRREDLYAVGGNDEDFVAPAFEDDWFADCLVNGRGLLANYRSDIIGHHLHHERPRDLVHLVRPSQKLYLEKCMMARAGVKKWEASGGPWEWKE